MAPKPERILTVFLLSTDSRRLEHERDGGSTAPLPARKVTAQINRPIRATQSPKIGNVRSSQHG
jgi:hypothetical protein